MELIEQKLTDLTTEMVAFTGKAKEEIKNLGAVTTETKTAQEAMKSQLFAMQTQLDALDAKTTERHTEVTLQKSLGELVIEHAAFLEAKTEDFAGKKGVHIHLPTGAFPIARKAVITTGAVGTQVTGVQQLQRLPGIVGMPMQELRIRDLMNVQTLTTGNAFEFLRQSVRTNGASPQIETSPKAESTYMWDSVSGTVKTIAHWTDVSKQALADIPWLRTMIDAELTYGLKVKEEAEILSGDGTGQHLDGILHQATAFNAALLSVAAGWTILDQLRYAKLQARLAGLATFAPSGFVLSPTDMAHIELLKDDSGLYIVGDPKSGAEVKTIWGLPTVESDSMPTGTFLTGAFFAGATLIDRQQVTVDISYETGNNFKNNLATILCEERIGLAVQRPQSFITGTFSSSPA